MPSDLDSADLWLSALRAGGRRPKTLQTYAYAVDHLRAWRQTDADLTTLTKLEARAFVRSMLDRYRPGSVRCVVKSLKAFYGWLVTEGEIEASPFHNVSVSVPDEEQKVVSDD